jgi:aryl-alcohol dehydrogenase-like predicted oxidoreductase
MARRSTDDGNAVSRHQQVMGMQRRQLGRSQLLVSPLGMGCWPIAGITSIDVHPDSSRATIEAAFRSGINFFDTAYCYGYAGESEQMVGEVLRPVRTDVVIATKGGILFDAQRKQQRDGRPEAILRQCDESLQRLGIEQIDLYYLHAPDPQVPIAESAGAIAQLISSGKVATAGLSNATTAQLAEFHAVCPLTAFQPHYNMLQREIELSQLPWCVEHQVSAVIYWPLMKGLLAGKLSRDHRFDARDGRQKYPMFHGEEWQKNHDFLDQLRPIAAQAGASLAELVLNWTIQRPGITVALCGAKRPEQIRENAAAMAWQLTAEQIGRIDAAIADRGPIVSRAAVA